jgi:hypothetical protein
LKTLRPTDIFEKREIINKLILSSKIKGKNLAQFQVFLNCYTVVRLLNYELWGIQIIRDSKRARGGGQQHVTKTFF